MHVMLHVYNVQEEVHKATEQLVSLQNQKLQLEQKLKEVYENRTTHTHTTRARVRTHTNTHHVITLHTFTVTDRRP